MSNHEYKARTVAIMKKHGITFHLNPGGGVFTHPEYGMCPVSAWDRKEDYLELCAWLEKNGISEKEKCDE